MPQCCFCFLQASGECGSDPTGEWLYRALGREELSHSSAKKEHWAKSCSGKTPGKLRQAGLEGMWFVLPSCGHSTALVPPALAPARVPHEGTDNGISGEAKTGKIQVPRLLSLR